MNPDKMQFCVNPLQPKSPTDLLAAIILLIIALIIAGYILSRALYFARLLYRAVCCANHSFRAGLWREQKRMKPGDWIIHDTLAGYYIKAIVRVGSDTLFVTPVNGIGSPYGSPVPLNSSVMPYNPKIADYLRCSK